jgi:hypothetical protein
MKKEQMIKKVFVNMQSVLDAEKQIKQIIGADWIERKLIELHKSNEEQKRLFEKGNRYTTHESFHPLIMLFYFSDMWIEATRKGVLEDINEHIVRLLHISSILENTARIKNFTKEIDRLKDKKEYFGAICELEVAYIYTLLGFRIEFVSETITRTSDLVLLMDDITIYVECKNRELLSDRDKKVANVWKNLTDFSIGNLFTQGAELALFVISASDPVIEDFAQLKDELVNIIANCKKCLDSNNGMMFSAMNKKYTILATKPRNDKNEVFVQLPISPDNSIVVTHTKKKSDRFEFDNVASFSYKNLRTSDIIPGIINAFNSGRKQIPELGPGIIWIKLPDNLPNDYSKRINEVKVEIEKQIIDSNNNRINYIFLLSNMWSQEQTEDGIELKMSFNIIELCHKNPKNKVYIPSVIEALSKM